MKVFISWSGERSKAVANTLRTWLPDVIQDVAPWMSAADIDAGARWSRNVQGQLSESTFGILCITRENQTAPWILFEAGALAKTIEDTYVCPYLVDLEPSEILVGPLTQFQAKTATEEGTRDLVRTLNRASREAALSEEKIDRAFGRWWPDLQDALSKLPAAKTPKLKRSRDDMLEEVLVGTREIRRLLQSSAAGGRYVANDLGPLLATDKHSLTKWPHVDVKNTHFRNALLELLTAPNAKPEEPSVDQPDEPSKANDEDHHE